jgi:hypothetical protein
MATCPSLGWSFELRLSGAVAVRLSGFEELQPESEASIAAVVGALASARARGDPWAAWGLAQRYRAGAGVPPSHEDAVACARAAAEGACPPPLSSPHVS